MNNVINPFLGYGHLTPITKRGKLFIVLYAMVGLPLTVVLLTVCVQKLEGPILKLIYFLEKTSSCCQSRLSYNYVKFINLVILTSIFWIFIITIPSLIFWLIEYPEWSQMDSILYFLHSPNTLLLYCTLYFPSSLQFPSLLFVQYYLLFISSLS